MTNHLSFRFDQALAFASGLHREQVRKGTTIPYISHLIAVCGIVIENGGDEDAAIGALLHDAVEDQGGRATLDVIQRLFGGTVAQIVEDCTDSWTDPKPEWRSRKEAYIASLAGKRDPSLLVSLADKLHNARTILADHRELGEGVWSRFTAGRDTLWYYSALAEAFTRFRPSPLAAELERTVSDLVRASA